MAHRTKPKAKRSYTLRVRLLPDEGDLIRQAAHMLSIPISDLVRRKMLGAAKQLAPRKSTLPGEILELNGQLAAVGNNLNQLVRHAHTGAFDADVLSDTLEEIRRVAAEVRGLLKRRTQ